MGSMGSMGVRRVAAIPFVRLAIVRFSQYKSSLWSSVDV